MGNIRSSKERPAVKLTDVFAPTVLISETHAPYIATIGVTAEAVSRIAQEGFYEGVEILLPRTLQERRRISQIKQSQNLRVVVWFSREQIDEKLSLSSPDEAHRKNSVSRLITLLESAADCRADTIALISDPDPGIAYREQAKRNLQLSLGEICTAARAYGDMRVIFEPLDREADKNCLLGPVAETVEMIKPVRQSHSNIDICWDSSHAALCGDDLRESLLIVDPYFIQMHFANAVLDRNSEGFGDRHMPIGPPGFLTIEKMAQLMQHVIRMRHPAGKRIYVSVEVRTQTGDPWQTEKHCRESLLAAWQLVEQEAAE